MEGVRCSVLGVLCSEVRGGRWEVAGGQCRLCGPPRFNAPRQGRRSPTSGFPRPASRVRLPASGFPRPTSRVDRIRQPRASRRSANRELSDPVDAITPPPLPLPLPPHAPIPTTYRVDASYVQCISSPTSTQCSALRRSRSARAGRFKRELLLKLFSGAAAGSSWPRLPPPRLRVQGSSGGRSTRAAGTRGSLRTTRLRSTSWRSTAWATRPRVSWPRCAPRTTSGSRET